MRKLILFGVFLVLMVACNKVDVPSSQQKTESDINAEAQYKKELDEIRESIKGETKIKVKKDVKGYSWEITGKDTQEILKTNDTLRKRLGD
jgi:uncharacterized FlaG/YvyC family protein